MRLSLAAARKYALIICMRLLSVLHTCAIYGIQITASLSDEDAVHLIESVVGGLHICKGVRSLTVFVGLQTIREDRNDDHFAACLQPLGVGLPRLFVGWLAIQSSL